MRKSALLIKKFGKRVFVCAWGWLQGVRQQRAGKPHPYGETAPESPIFHLLLPPNTITKYLTHHPTHTHAHTADVLENRLKSYDGETLQTDFTVAKPQSASALSHHED